MKSQTFLIVTALSELATGAALLIAPSFVADLLLGDTLVSPVSIVVGRVAGAALAAIGLMCWLGRAGAASAAALLAGLLLYNAAVALLLAQGAVSSGLDGMLLGPVAALHSVFALWCALLLRRRTP